MKRIYGTNRVLPEGIFKTDILQKLFAGWVNKFKGSGRLFTIRFCKEVIGTLRNEFGLDPQSRGDVEAIRLHRLLKVARKRKLGGHPQVKARAMSCGSAADNIETQVEQAGLCGLYDISLATFF